MARRLVPCNLVLFVFVLLQQAVLAHGFAPPSKNRRTAVPVSLKSTNTMGIEKEQADASKTIQSCAGVAAMAGLFDFGLQQAKKGGWDLSSPLQAFLFELVALWKLSLAAHLVYMERVKQTKIHSKKKDDDRRQGISALLQATANIWGQSAFLVAMTSSVRVVLVWQDRIPPIAGFVGLILGALVVAATSIAKKESKNVLGGQEPANQLQKQAAVSTRAIALCVAALVFRIGSIPALSLGNAEAGVVGKALGMVKELPTPLGIALSLDAFRKSLLQAMKELSGTKKLELKPETQVELARSQTTFYSRVRKMLIVEMIVKTIAKLVELKNNE